MNDMMQNLIVLWIIWIIIKKSDKSQIYSSSILNDVESDKPW